MKIAVVNAQSGPFIHQSRPPCGNRLMIQQNGLSSPYRYVLWHALNEVDEVDEDDLAPIAPLPLHRVPVGSSP